jgi:hypothetical protein
MRIVGLSLEALGFAFSSIQATRAYKAIPPGVPHKVINHHKQSADDEIHSNTIEGLW